MTPWNVSSAVKVANACPGLLRVPGIDAIDAMQAWSVWTLLCQQGARPCVLEVGHGPWARVLATMTRSLGGDFYSLGVDDIGARSLERDLALDPAPGRASVLTTNLVDTELDGRTGRLPDPSSLPPGARFQLVWVTSSHVLANPGDLHHVLPLLAPHLSLGGFNVLIESPDPGIARSAASFWESLGGESLTTAQGALHDAGLLVIGRAQDPLESRHATSPSFRAPCARSTIKRPALTLPAAEAEELKRQYMAATTILEYGSGGSTIVAAELPGKVIFSVESDPKWLCRMNTYLQATALASMPITYYADIGVTKEWGRPAGTEGRVNYPDYSRGIWQQDFFQQPDLVLIDGRFRPACFLVTASEIEKPTIVLFDDYGDRPHYHFIEEVASPERMIGRMAVFHLHPGQFKPQHLALLEKALYEPE